MTDLRQLENQGRENTSSLNLPVLHQIYCDVHWGGSMPRMVRNTKLLHSSHIRI